MNGLPANLPSIAHAKLPALYEGAKAALLECSRIDECKAWQKKAEAMASYAKQAEDDTLFNFATRIKARAVRRCGDLLKEISSAQGARTDVQPRDGGDTKSARPTKTQTAREAGLSERQQITATRVARIPEPDFERAVESPNPPTVTKLAEQGRVSTKPLVDLKGRDPQEFARSTEGQGHLRRLVEFTEKVSPAIVARGAFPREHAAIRKHIDAVMPWLMTLMGELEGVRA